MRLKKYISMHDLLLLTEKVSKKDISSILNSDDILIGGEFEFVSYYLERFASDNQELQDDFENAYSAWEDYNIELQKYEEDKEDIVLDFNREADILDDKIEEVENNIEDLATDDYKESDTENIIKRLENKLSVLQNRLEELEKKRDEELENLETPEVPDDLLNYSEKYNNGYNSVYSSYSGGEELPEPEMFDRIIDLEDGYVWIDIVGGYFRDLTNPPFDRWEVGEYGDIEQDVGSKTWAIESDSSISDKGYGMEIKSPPMTIKEFVKVCPKMFSWIDKNGYTNSKCGFHIHMSLKKVPDLTKGLDIIKLTMFTDEGYIFKFFPERVDNTYVRSMKKQLSKEGIITQDDWKDFIDIKKLKNKTWSDHMNSINWEGLEDDDQHIEFRYMGGSQYHKKWDKIKAIIAQYGYNLNLACNPNSHRKEYALKIQRMLNKLEMLKIREKYSYLSGIKDGMPEEWKEIHKYIDKEYKKYRKRYLYLYNIYGDKAIKDIEFMGDILQLRSDMADILLKKLPKDVKMAKGDFILVYL